MEQGRTVLKAFGSLKSIREASVEDIAAVKGMTGQTAERVKAALTPGAESS